MVMVSRVAGGLLRSLVAGVFGAAGTVVGAVYGLLSAAFVVQDDDGFVRGTLVGAIAGALVSVDLAHSILAIWCCSSVDMRIKRTVSAVSGLPVLADPHSGRGGRVLFDRTSFGFSPPVAVVVVAKGAAVGGSCCPICLQEFEAGGETAGRLPACSHVFHLGCIRRWLLCKSHCPMCRHTVNDQ
ncbi:hypothetical protein ACQ4PT_062636 [Festuca glaucescens]